MGEWEREMGEREEEDCEGQRRNIRKLEMKQTAEKGESDGRWRARKC